MSLRKSFVFLAAAMLAALQGCETPQTTAPGDRSSEGVGSVAFRLSEQNVAYLQTQALYMQYEVSGPGMDTIYQSSALDTTPVFLNGIPCGTRIVRVDVIDMFGAISWTGADTVEINPNRTTMAHVVLHRPMQLGGLLIDVTLDSASLADTSYRHLDTVWRSVVDTGWGWYSYDRCDNPVAGGSNTFYTVSCYHVQVIPMPGDTTWVDTIVRRPNDTAKWCQVTQIDSTIMRGAYRCYSPTYVPYSYRDTVWQDSTVGTASLNNTTWCHPSVWPSDSSMYCFKGKYQKLPAGTCERIHYGNGFPQGELYNCADSTNTRKPRSVSPDLVLID